MANSNSPTAVVAPTNKIMNVATFPMTELSLRSPEMKGIHISWPNY